MTETQAHRRGFWAESDFDHRMIGRAKAGTLIVRVRRADDHTVTATLIGWWPKRARVRYSTGSEATVRREQIILPDDMKEST